MTQPMEKNWFREELTHLEHLAKIVPDSPVVASMLSTFLTRMKANQCWTSQAIVALLRQATNIQLPEPNAQAVDGNRPILAMCHREPHEARERRATCASIGAISQPE